MKITHNDKYDIYNIYLEYPETEIHIKPRTNDIAEVRELFLDAMRDLFDDVICEKLKKSF